MMTHCFVGFILVFAFLFPPALWAEEAPVPEQNLWEQLMGDEDKAQSVPEAKPEKQPESAQGKESKAGETTDSTKGRDSLKDKPIEEQSPRAAEDDRRWIIKMNKPKVSSSRPESPQVKYENEIQEAGCRKKLAMLQESFAETRQDSIKGDHCSTARHAKTFLHLAESCKKECPPDFLEKNGYTPRILRNFELLQQLGQERCLQ